MASFEPAYKLERKHEGYYVNNPADKGGKTYAGVAYNIHPTWSGWPVVDAYQKQIGRELKTNEKMPDSTGIEDHVKSFYKNLWDRNGFGNIANQDVANIVYDFYINSGNTGIKKTQEVLRDKFAKPIGVDGAIGTQTINAINAVDSAKLNDAIKAKRIEFYNGLVAKNPSQSVFLKGWLSRINSFPTLTKAGLGIGVLLTGVGLFFLTVSIVKNRKKKK
jgi:lysozyme family protein